MLKKVFDKFFDNYNERQLAILGKEVVKINSLAADFESLSDDELRGVFVKWKDDFSKDEGKMESEKYKVFAAVREASKRLVGYKYEILGKEKEWDLLGHYDVQLIGGLNLHGGNISEMKTGEGKTFVCTLPVILNALTGKGVHVITVNDYLAKRDAEWMKPLYDFCGLSVGVIVGGKNPEERREAYGSDITYGTNNEFGFDYLRDNMAQNPENLVQRDLYFAIVDEVDSILIDEARTPLIISAPADDAIDRYEVYSDLVKNLKEEEDFTVDLKQKQVILTEKGVMKAEEVLGLSNIYTEAGFAEVHHIESALKAAVVMKRDEDYVVQGDRVVIVDEFTGRMMPGRRYSDGLHQALEAKENVTIQQESKTLATITFQNYFRLYEKLAGMTGTAETEAEEFAKIYDLDVVVIPTNRDIARVDLQDKIFKNESGKFKHLIEEIKELNGKGQPILIGTVNINKSELISEVLSQAGIAHEVLNAKHHEREAEIIAKAGQKGAVTIATNMAGRGTDIKLGDGVKELGGLAILGTERHESRRIDNQLRGRAGRQGDAGFSQFYVAMTDDLMRRFGGDRMAGMMERLGLPEEEAIENGMISKSVENAQKKIEGFHFDARKHVVQYDDVMNIHREKIYARRKKLLGTEDILLDIEDLIRDAVEFLVVQHATREEADHTWDTTTIAQEVNAIHLDEEKPIAVDELEQFHHRSELMETLQNYLLKSWDAHHKNLPDEGTNDIAKQILLRSIDAHWLDHIDEMTQLRDRVALVGYAQKDPLTEYKNESFEMFSRLLQQIRLTSLKNIFRIEFVAQAPEFRNILEDRKLSTNADQIVAQLENTAEYNVGQKNAPVQLKSENPGQSVVSEKLGKKYENVGRNDLCPCGSGKKFKKCHGKDL